jgi:hypothetical protein
MTTTDSDKLHAAAVEALGLNNNDVKKTAPVFARTLIENAKRPLLVALVADYLSRLGTAPTTQPAPRRVPPPKPIGRRRKGKHRRNLIGMPTMADKRGSVAAMKLVAGEIFNYKIRGVGPLGEIPVSRLISIAESLADTSAQFVLRGHDDGVDSIAMLIMAKHCVAADPFAPTKDVIPAKVAVKAFEAARKVAPEVIQETIRLHRANLIASARQQPSPQLELSTEIQ